MRPTKFFRKGATIRTFNSNDSFKDKTYYSKDGKPSINAAKRASREKQIENDGRMASGILRVVDKLPSVCRAFD